jgi:DNA-directed RNA polymerase specialized sigma24 family protein
MSSIGDVTRLLQQLKAGDRQAVQPLWDRYFRRLVGLARERLRGMPRAARDEEDLALSAFDSFCRAAEAGRFPRLDDSLDLWKVLSMIARRKVCDQVEHDGREMRDHQRTRPLDDEEIQKIFDTEPCPDEAAVLAEEMSRLLGLLTDRVMRDIAVRKLEGYTNKEIAKELNWSLATVERRLPLIREIWQRELPA